MIVTYNVIVLVVIIDPGIKVDHGYKPYDDGISKGVFVKVRTYVCIFWVCTYSVELLPLVNM